MGLESGEIRRLASDFVLTYAPGERVLSVVPEESPNGSIEQMFDMEWEAGDVVLLDNLWRFQTLEPNVLLLDQWQVTLNDRQSRMNATMPGQVNTYRTTFTMTQELLERLQSPSGGGLPYQSNNNPSPKIELILDDVEQKILPISVSCAGVTLKSS